MDELIKAIKLLLGHSDRAEATKLLKEHGGAVHQAVFQEGFDVGYGKRAGENDTLRQQVATLTTDKDTAVKALDEARRTTPDTAALHKQYADQITELTTKHQQTLATVNGTLHQERTARFKADLRGELVKQGVDPDYAEIIAERPTVIDRLKFDEAGTRQILQLGRDIPFAPTEKKQPLSQLAEALRTDVPPKFLAATGDQGAGDRGGPVPLAGSAASLVKQIQEDAAKQKAAALAGANAPAALPPALARIAVGSQ